MFQAMLIRTDGSMARAPLEQLAAAGGEDAKIAEALLKFVPLGASGSADTVIDWTEMLAAATMVGSLPKGQDMQGLPKIEPENGALHRAFDLLSLGSGELTAS